MNRTFNFILKNIFLYYNIDTATITTYKSNINRICHLSKNILQTLLNNFNNIIFTFSELSFIKKNLVKITTVKGEKKLWSALVTGE